MHCVVLENDILKFIEEIENQLKKEVICGKCKKPCDKNTRCAVAMKNLLTDVELFRKAYTDYKEKAEAELEEEKEKAEEEKVKIEEEVKEEDEEDLLLDDVATKLRAVEAAIEKQL